MPERHFISADKYVLAMSREAKAVASVPQDTPVTFETRDCFSGSLKSEDEPFTNVGWDRINPATGPVFVEGAEPGDILRVFVEEIQVASSGVIAAAPGFGALPATVTEATRLVRVEGGRAYFRWPRKTGADLERALPIRPMIGVIGVAPAGDAVPTGTPDCHGGNMDCQRIVQGAVLYLPVFVPGALLALGDLHAVMADGEVAVCGLEIAGQVTLSCRVLKGVKLPTPLLLEGGEIMTLASALTLDEAAALATLNMQTFLVETLKLDPTAAAMLLSVEGELRICQIVDPLKTARMEISLEVLQACGYALP
jgi:amidase